MTPKKTNHQNVPAEVAALAQEHNLDLTRLELKDDELDVVAAGKGQGGLLMTQNGIGATWGNN